MKLSLKKLQFIGFALTSLGGTVLHFLYHWLNEAVWIAPFSGINESTWEHMKLLFFPTFIFAIIESRFFKGCEKFWCVKLRGTVLGIVLIPVLFYTYNGAIGQSPDWINIVIFFVSSASAFIYETYLFKKTEVRCVKPKLAIISLCVIALLFVVFTFATPKIGIFKDPVTEEYGMESIAT